MSSEHSPVGSNESQDPSEQEVGEANSHTNSYEDPPVQGSSDEGTAGTGPDRQSVPADEVVSESNTESMKEAMASMLALLIHQQEVQAKRAEERALAEAKRAEERALAEAKRAEERAAEAEETKAILLKMAQILGGKESTVSPTAITAKTSYIYI